MVCRFVTDSEMDRQRVREIWKYCFQDPDWFIDWYFKEKYSPENTIGIWEDEILVSNLQMIPYDLSVRGARIPASYLVGVATMPEARGKGYMKELITKALESMKERGRLISCLYPFQYSFYRNFGWETCYERLEYKLSIADLRGIAGARKDSVTFRPLDLHKDLEGISSIYTKAMNEYTGYVYRYPRDWERRLGEHYLDDGYAYVAVDGGEIKGYLLYHLDGKAFLIDEMVYDTYEIYRKWMGFIRDHSSQMENVVWNAPSNDKLFLELSDSRSKVSLNPHVMLRICDVQSFITALGISCDLSEKATVRIEDAYAPWNNKTFLFKSYKGVLAAEPVNEPGECRCSIGVFTQMTMGYLTPCQAYRQNKIQVADERVLHILKRIFSQKYTMVHEIY